MMPNGTHIASGHHYPHRQRIKWLLGLIIGAASGMMAGWLLVTWLMVG